MQPKRRNPRLIAIDLRSQQFGYAIFEGPNRLLDCGGSQLRPGGKTGSLLAVKRIGRLIKIYNPSIIVMKRPSRPVITSRPSINRIAKAMKLEASRHGIPFRLIGRADIQEAFSVFKARSKFEIAVVATRIFPELQRKLPAKRKLGDPEHPRMVVFDAISVGFTHWQQHSKDIPPCQ